MKTGGEEEWRAPFVSLSPFFTNAFLRRPPLLPSSCFGSVYPGKIPEPRTLTFRIPNRLTQCERFSHVTPKLPPQPPRLSLPRRRRHRSFHQQPRGAGPRRRDPEPQFFLEAEARRRPDHRDPRHWWG